MTIEEVTEYALSLPETTEEPHFERRSFRVRGKIFATAPPEGDALNVMLDEHAVRAAIAEDPRSCEELWWGKKLSGVRVILAGADPALVRSLLHEAWQRKAPGALRRP